MSDVRKLGEKQRKIFILGAGFDKVFGMPLWSELITLYKGFILTNSNKNFVELEKKLNTIIKMNTTLARKFQMMENAGKKHDYEKDKTIEFLKTVLDINKYSINKDIMENVFSKFNSSNDIFITTNLSNTFLTRKWNNFFAPIEAGTKKILPIHGCVFPESDNKLNSEVIRESDFIQNIYKERINLIDSIIDSSGIEEIHIFGYSMGDFEIFKTIVNAKVKKIIIYAIHDDEEIKEIHETYFRDILTRDDREIEFLPEWNDSQKEKNKDELYSDLLNDLANKTLESKTKILQDIDSWDQDVEDA